MAARPALIAASVAGTVALGTAGYFANEWRACRMLEAGFLEETIAIGTDLQSADAMHTSINEEQVGDRVAASVEKANRLYSRIRSRCGEETAAAVQRKGLDTVENMRRSTT